MQINLQKAMLVTAVTAAAGIALTRTIVYRDLYKSFPDVDHSTLRMAYRSTMANAVKGEYVAGLSSDEVQALLRNEIRRVS